MKTFIAMVVALFISQNSYGYVGVETVIEAANGPVLIQNLEPGDEFLTIKEGSTLNSITNISTKLGFKQGGQVNDPVLNVSFGNNQSLVMTLDQAVLTANGVLVEAKKLTTKDSLVGKNGSLIVINSIVIGSYNKPMQDIGVSSKLVTENLYLANGVYLGNLKISSNLSAERVMRAFVGQEL